MNRRGFLGSVLALGAAPAIVRASSLMPIWTPPPVTVATIAETAGFGFASAEQAAAIIAAMNEINRKMKELGLWRAS